jgi:hypothetical protein
VSWSGQALAMHSMIRHGYSTCSTCHADPSGAGLLTAYGRGLAEMELRTRYGKQRDDAEPGRIANSMMGAFRMPDWLQLQVDGRHLLLVPAARASKTRYSLMQADGAAHLKLGRFRAGGSLGYAYQGALGASVTRGDAQLEHRLVARTYWLGVGLAAEEQLVLRAGRMNLPFGLRSIEHTMFVRMATRTNINDQQQLGVALAWNAPSIRAELMVVAGNFQVRPDDFRERGYSAYFEWSPFEKLAIGASSLVTHAALDIELGTALWRHAHGLFARWSPLRWLVASLESNLLFYSQPPAGGAAANNVAGNASALLLDFEPLRGLHLLGAAELQNRNIAGASTDYGFWAGAWWFFLPHLDVRADLNWSTVGGQSATYLLFQLHGYL